MASVQVSISASGPASEFVGRCSSLVETALPSCHTPATLDVVAPPSVPMYTSRPLISVRPFHAVGAYVVDLVRVNGYGQVHRFAGGLADPVPECFQVDRSVVRA